MGVVKAFQPETRDGERWWKIVYEDNDIEDLNDNELATGAALFQFHESNDAAVATVEEGTRIATLIGKSNPVRPLYRNIVI